MINRTIINDQYYYHIFNRGTEKRKIFLDKWDYVRFLEEMRWFNQTEAITSLYHFKKRRLSGSTSPAGAVEPLNKPLINILAYCLNQNHYHLLVEQVSTDGISRFMQKLGTGYTCYFNDKYKRTGSLFQGKYKFKPIKSIEELLKLSVYINCNAEIHGIAKKESWIWSSYLDYIGKRNGTLCNKNDIYIELSSPTAPAGEVGLLTKQLGFQYEKLCKEWTEDSKRIKYFKKYDLD